MVVGKAALEMPRALQSQRAASAKPVAADGAVANLNEAAAAVDGADGAGAGTAPRRAGADGDEEATSAAAEAAEAVLRTSYTPAESERAFRHIVDFHTKQGWISMNQLES